MRYAPGLAVLVALAVPVAGQSLDDARTALAFGRVDAARAMAEPLAAAGQAEALALLGLIARDAIPPDIDTALAYLRSAAASGSPTAEAALGRAYQLGQLGLPPDTARAYDHFERAAAAGSRVAEVNLIALVASGALGDPDWPALRARLGDLAEEGIPGATVTLAEMLATGRGRELDPDRARRLAEAAAERGDPQALRLLGWMRLQGVGGAVDAPAGLAALERAAMAGNGAAATDLGLLHRDGTGVPSDPATARDWFRRAPRRGMAGAQRTWRGSWATGTTAYPTIPRTPLRSSARATPGASRRRPMALRWPIGTARARRSRSAGRAPP
jgi:TPR repeat protein